LLWRWGLEAKEPANAWPVTEPNEPQYFYAGQLETKPVKTPVNRPAF
jgi:hypothetical protein